MSELLSNLQYKKEKLKKLLKDLHEGKDVEILKEEFKEVLKNISPIEIPLVEQELLKEGISAKNIAKMCDLHVEVFRESLEKSLNINEIPQDHPLHTLILENRNIMKDAEVLSIYARSIENSLENIRILLKELSQIGRTHYNREEMLIFPYLERRGITAVPTVLWTKHDEIRYKIKYLNELLEESENPDLESLKEQALKLSQLLSDMVYRENNILYPTLHILLSESEWRAIKEQEELFGYYKITPGNDWRPSEEPVHPFEIDPNVSPEKLMNLPQSLKNVINGRLKPDESRFVRENDLKLDEGYLSLEEVSAIFKTIPVDVTFIDKDDKVRFFSGGERVFPRTPSVLGRPVQMCHPPRSVHIVNKILKAFKSGRRSSAEFWINMGGKLIYIRYIPVFDSRGNYLGTVEVTQDVSSMKKLEGEKRLLDWED